MLNKSSSFLPFFLRKVRGEEIHVSIAVHVAEDFDAQEIGYFMKLLMADLGKTGRQEQ